MRIAVISDVHAAHAPFAKALSDARSTGFDQLVILGDLFTYGIEPRQCAELAVEAIAMDGAILVGGNHDELYIDLDRGDRRYYDRLPEWIRESVEWTRSALGGQWPDGLGCVLEWSRDDLLLAHANPFGPRDWTYLSNEELLGRAAEVCAARGFRYGVFGHLHRPVHFSTPDCDIRVIGSVGQPRSPSDPAPHWALIEIDDGKFSFTRHDIAFDAAAHCAAIQRHPDFTDGTKAKLCGFFA